MSTKLVIWDIDKVWYPDISTTYAAAGSAADPAPYLKRFVEEKKWFTYDDVHKWSEKTGRNVDSVGAVADMLTDFLYKMKPEIYGSVSDQEAKDRTIEGKQSLLAGLTIGEVKRIADNVPYTEGLSETVDHLSTMGIHQVGFSDGLGPFVAHKMADQSVEIGGIVPAALELSGQELWIDRNSLHLMHQDDAKLLGKAGSFKKSEEIFSYVSSRGYGFHQTAAIDDSAANISILSRIRDNGGIAVGFNPNDIKRFEEAKIPVLHGMDLLGFAALLLEPRKIKQYCETWGIDP